MDSCPFYAPFDTSNSTASKISEVTCGLVCQKQVSRAGTSNYISQILWGVIPCPWLDNYLGHKSSNVDDRKKHDYFLWIYWRRFLIWCPQKQASSKVNRLITTVRGEQYRTWLILYAHLFWLGCIKNSWKIYDDYLTTLFRTTSSAFGQSP